MLWSWGNFNCCLFFFFLEDISTDGEDLTLSKRVPVETSCSSAQSFQNASSAKTAGIYFKKQIISPVMDPLTFEWCVFIIKRVHRENVFAILIKMKLVIGFSFAQWRSLGTQKAKVWVSISLVGLITRGTTSSSELKIIIDAVCSLAFSHLFLIVFFFPWKII